jgi:hypothetical protein
MPILVRPSPRLAVDRGAEREAGVDVGEGADLVLAIVPAPAAEHADVVGHRLLDVEVIAVLGAALPSLHDRVGWIEARAQRHQHESLVVAAGEIGIRPDADPQLAGTREQRVARLELGDVAAAPEQVHVELVRVWLVAGEEIAGAHGPVGQSFPTIYVRFCRPRHASKVTGPKLRVQGYASKSYVQGPAKVIKRGMARPDSGRDATPETEDAR